MATKGGGEFFGKVGSFENGYEFDALVIDDSLIKTTIEFPIKERLERVVNLVSKFVSGNKIF